MHHKHRTRLTSAMAVALTLAGPAVGASARGAAAANEDHSAVPQTVPLEVEQPSRAPQATEAVQREVVGLTVKNTQGIELGTIRNVIVTPSGRISHVVLASGGVLGMWEDLYQVPWPRIHWSPDMNHALLDVEKAQLKAEFSAFEPAARSN